MQTAWAVGSNVLCGQSTDISPGTSEVRGIRGGFEGVETRLRWHLALRRFINVFQAPESGHADLFYVGRAWQAGGGLRSDCKTWKRNMLNVLIQSCQEIPWPTTSLVSAPVSINVGHYSLSGFASLGKISMLQPGDFGKQWTNSLKSKEGNMSFFKNKFSLNQKTNTLTFCNEIKEIRVLT